MERETASEDAGVLDSQKYRALMHIFSEEAAKFRDEFFGCVDSARKGDFDLVETKDFLCHELAEKNMRLSEDDLRSVFWILAGRRFGGEFNQVLGELLEMFETNASEEKLSEQLRGSLRGLLKCLSRAMAGEISSPKDIDELEDQFEKFLENHPDVKSSEGDNLPLTAREMVGKIYKALSAKLAQAKMQSKNLQLESKTKQIAGMAKAEPPSGLYAIPGSNCVSKIPYEKIKPGLIVEVEIEEGDLLTTKWYRIVGKPFRGEKSRFMVRVYCLHKMGTVEKYETIPLEATGIISDEQGRFDEGVKLKDYDWED